MLEARGVAANARSLGERVAAANGGILVADDGCVSWVLDAGVLHAYDFAGNPEAIAPLVAQLDAIANASFAAVVATTLWDDDGLLEALEACDFVVDWNELDVRAGQPTRLLGLLRQIG